MKTLRFAVGLVLTISAVVLATTAAKPAAADDPAVVGQWSSTFQLPYKAVHATLLPNAQQVMFWPSFDDGDNPQLWNIAAGTTKAASPAGWNIFCSGHAYLSDGRLFLAGGHLNACPYGLPNAAIYDPTTDSWVQLPNMNAGRWYPTVLTLTNGDMLVIAGTIDPTQGENPLPQVWQTATNTWRDLTSAQLILPEYPRMFVAPNGNVIYVGHTNVTRYLNTDGTGKWGRIITHSLFGNRTYGSAVMYGSGKILIMGGGNPPTATAEIINLNNASPAWQYTGSMHYARRQINATILPDGSVLVTGGSSGADFDDKTHPVFPAEIWDPHSGQWTVMAGLSVYRGYHSTAVLLPDGRVFSGGGEKSSNTGEVFSPPYLFKGGRPTISVLPSSATYNSTIQVTSPNAAGITQVSLLGLGAVTHAFNMNQRINFLSFKRGTGVLNVTMPRNGNLAPPGHYLLFIVNGKGIPSVGRVIALS